MSCQTVNAGSPPRCPKVGTETLSIRPPCSPKCLQPCNGTSKRDSHPPSWRCLRNDSGTKYAICSRATHMLCGTRTIDDLLVKCAEAFTRHDVVCSRSVLQIVQLLLNRRRIPFHDEKMRNRRGDSTSNLPRHLANGQIHS